MNETLVYLLSTLIGWVGGYLLSRWSSYRREKKRLRARDMKYMLGGVSRRDVQ